jgi:hypothetical protein
MRLECPANVETLAGGELACLDELGAPVAWEVEPSFDVSELDPAELGGAWAAGFVLVATALVIGKGFAAVLDAIRGRWS